MSRRGDDHGWGGLLAWGATGLFLASCSIHSPNAGDKVGQVAKVQDAGYLCTTTEVLITGKFGGGELHLTVPVNLRDEVKKANESQAFVKVNYHTEMINFRCRNATDNQWLDSVVPQTQGAP